MSSIRHSTRDTATQAKPKTQPATLIMPWNIQTLHKLPALPIFVWTPLPATCFTPDIWAIKSNTIANKGERLMNLDTICVQGAYQPKNGEPRVIPIVQSTTFKYDSSDEMGDLFDLKKSGYFYSRLQ